MSVREIDAMVNGRIKMLIASKNIMFLEGIGAILRQDPSIEIVGEARTLEDTIDKTDRLLPHIVLLDAVLTDGSTLEAIERMRKRHEEIGILVLNVSERVPSTAEVLKAGASAYVRPEARIDQLMALIRATSPTNSSGRKQSSRNIQTRSGRAVRKPRKPAACTSVTPDEMAALKASLPPAITQTEILRAKEGRNG